VSPALKKRERRDRRRVLEQLKGRRSPTLYSPVVEREGLGLKRGGGFLGFVEPARETGSSSGYWGGGRKEKRSSGLKESDGQKEPA